MCTFVCIDKAIFVEFVIIIMIIISFFLKKVNYLVGVQELQIHTTIILTTQAYRVCTILAGVSACHVL